MRARLEDKRKAIELRKKGQSYREIQKIIPVSKGLLSRWLAYLDLSPSEEALLKSRIREIQDRGRIRSLISNRSRRIERERIVIDEAKKIFEKEKSNPLFLTGVLLYWAEGAKSIGDFQFINSDPEMILIMYHWIEKFLVPKEKIKVRIFIHDIPGYETVHKFWSKKLDLEPYLFQKTIYKPTTHRIKKDPHYKGCVRLTVGGVRYLRLMKAWQRCFIEYYGKALFSARSSIG